MLKRFLQLLLVSATFFTLMGATNPANTFKHLGGQMMCTCGCAEMLLECNHVGCPDSPALITELHGQVSAGHSEKDILAFFAAKYGPTVLAAPLRGGFDNVAWIMPFAVFALGLVAVVLVLQMWKRRAARLAPAAPIPPSLDANALRDRIRDETQYGE
jgi:cytochrome c-type biogenesis protein CcmH/NrfF